MPQACLLFQSAENVSHQRYLGDISLYWIEVLEPIDGTCFPHASFCWQWENCSSIPHGWSTLLATSLLLINLIQHERKLLLYRTEADCVTWQFLTRVDELAHTLSVFVYMLAPVWRFLHLKKKKEIPLTVRESSPESQHEENYFFSFEVTSFLQSNRLNCKCLCLKLLQTGILSFLEMHRKLLHNRDSCAAY